LKRGNKKEAMRAEEPQRAVEATKRRGGSRSEPRRSGGVSTVDAAATPDPQVPERPARRRFSAGYKLEVLKEADVCTEPGQVGELLRRHGLYSSHLTTWRRERELGALERLDKKRGRKAKPRNPLAGRVAELERENRRLSRRLKQAEVVIDVQKKVSEILGIPLNTPDTEGDD
jgi:transposase-like protein